MTLLVIPKIYFTSFFDTLLLTSRLRFYRLFCSPLHKVCSEMNTYERNPSYKKPVLSNPTGVFHFFFQYQAQIQSSFFLQYATLLFFLDVVFLRTCKRQTIWPRNVVLVRDLENRATFDSVPPQVYESN